MKKRLLSALLALVMVCALATPASAAAGSLTLTEIVSSETIDRLTTNRSWNGKLEFSDGGVAVIGTGTINMDGRVVVQPDIYKWETTSFANGVIWASRDSYVCAIGQDGKELFTLDKSKYSVTRDSEKDGFHDGLARIYSIEAKKYGYIDMTGKIVIPCEYNDKAGAFRNGLAPVYNAAEAFWGYIDKTGRLAIPYQYADASEFIYGVAVVQIGNRITLIDTTGREVMPSAEKYETAGILPQSIVAWNIEDGGFCFFDMTGQLVDGGYDDVGGLDFYEFYELRDYDLSEVMIPVIKGGKYGYVNVAGKLVIPCRYADAEPFTGEYGMVREERNGSWIVIDRTGNKIATLPQKGSYAGEGYFKISSNESGRTRYGFANSTGQEIVPCKYAKVGNFSGGVATVSDFENKVGFVDTNGTLIVPCQYKRVEYSNVTGIFAVQDENSKWSVMKASDTATPTTPDQPAATATADPTNDKLSVDGKDAAPAAYKIGGANYFKLRDVAALLNGTSAQFEISYDNDRKAINITTGKAYTPQGYELKQMPTGKAEALTSSDTVYVNGQKLELTAYKIGGANFYGIRDLGRALGFNVGWKQGTGMYIESDKPYSDAD